jgi:hypothetical protein
MGRHHLVPLLTPQLSREVPVEQLQALTHHFHALIRQRASELVRQHALRLPELEPLLETQVRKVWFPIPGMYGGFVYWLDEIADRTVLITESWSRVVGDSGECHVVSPSGFLLLESGFV